MDISNNNTAKQQIQLNVINTGCCCPEAPKPRLDLKNKPRWAIGAMDTPLGQVYKISSEWTHHDYLGEIRSRISSFRMSYAVEPGLYAIGDPTPDSDILVSANYKLSFDMLRKSIKGLNAWILVLDTKGINVWCAAGKGTFGTDELIKRIENTNLAAIANHRRIIVPQLGAPGVCADSVKKATGFRVYFGPVRASDIHGYISNKYSASKEMRRVTFGIMDRLILTPIEINPLLKVLALFSVAALAIFGLQPTGILFNNALMYGLPIIALALIAALAGAVVTPALLPYIPFRSFAIKGWITGAIMISAAVFLTGLLDFGGILLISSSLIFFPMASSYISLQFTGATTFTSLSGVKKELRYGMPVYRASAVLSSILLIAYKIREWGII